MSSFDVDARVKRDGDAGSPTRSQPQPQSGTIGFVSGDDDGIIPKGQIDPVYEAKAQVLNHAARPPLPPESLSSSATTRLVVIYFG